MDPTLMTTEPTLEAMDITRGWFRIDPDVQQRVGLTPEWVAQYATAYRDGVILDPIVVFFDEPAQCWWLSEGFHRCAAAMQVGIAHLDAHVYRGDKRAAILHAVAANRHGLERSDADKRKAVTTLLTDPEWSLWSDREIAYRCGVSPTFVGRVRKSLSTVDSENGDKTRGQSTTRQYVTKHGTVATMHTGGIGSRNGVARCGDCGRPLSDPASISRGIGPICACKAPGASGSPSAGSHEAPSRALAQAPLGESAASVPQLPPRPGRQASPDDVEGVWVRCVLDQLNRLAPLVGVREVYPWPPTSPNFSTAWVRELVDACVLRWMPVPAHVEAPAAPAEPPAPARDEAPVPAGRSGTYGQIPAKVLAALQAHGTDGATAHTLATAVAVPYGQVWTSLDRLVKQGKAVKEGTLYRTTKGEA